MKNIKIALLGLIGYAEALEIQEKLLEAVKRGESDDTLLLLEHPPVLTLGRRGEYANILVNQDILLENDVNTYEVNRGGDVTYHGPGQIVGYPIMNLNNHGKDVRDFVWKVQEVFIRLLKEEYNIDAHREYGKYTGVWVGNEKIAAIGIAIKRWVTMHGFAFNVSTNLEHFKWINSCGLADRGVTSLQKLLGHPMDFSLLNEKVIKYFCEVFERLPTLPQQPLSVISILFRPNPPSPEIKATCLWDQSLINLSLSKLCVAGITAELKPNFLISLLIKLFKSNIS